MGYHGGSLVDLVKADTVQPPTRAALRGIAGAAGDRMTALARQHTPKWSGKTASSWYQLPVERTHVAGEPAYTSGVASDYFVARFIEYGVSPHAIRPDDAEAIDTPEGPRAGAHHPGFGGHFPVTRAADETDVMLDEIATPHLSLWAEQIEVRAAQHVGIQKA